MANIAIYNDNIGSERNVERNKVTMDVMSKI